MLEKKLESKLDEDSKHSTQGDRSEKDICNLVDGDKNYYYNDDDDDMNFDGDEFEDDQYSGATDPSVIFLQTLIF